MTQGEFANRLGVGRATLIRYEKDENEPTASVLQILIKDFGADPQWLLLGAGQPPHPELSRREACLIANYRASPEEGQRSVETMASLLAKRDKDLKDVG
jgi:transcriptional regulator with XRE-family HTH domain